MTRIRLEYHGHVAYITLDHPPANTWTLASLQAFLQMMVELDSRPDVVALACDIRIAEQQALLGLPEASVGLLPCAGGTQRLTELVGPGWAKRMILCGEKVSASLAYEMGLVEEVVKTGQAWEAAHQMAHLVERQSPSALRACKTLINQGRSGPRDAALPLERSLFLDLFSDANQREGVAAFLEKRLPRWQYGPTE
ncbi:enoyl-CoA hydratase-related protein [Aeromonas sp. 3P]|uniref:enoyl-CoA hydratase-related protein n=1 Tax=Aeromonas sp. 3P TaxID=3452719 RepID=UPI003F7A05C0